MKFGAALEQSYGHPIAAVHGRLQSSAYTIHIAPCKHTELQISGDGVSNAVQLRGAPPPQGPTNQCVS